MGGSDSRGVFSAPRFCSALLTGWGGCPCRVGSGLLLCPGFPLRGSRSVCRATLPSPQSEPDGSPKFLTLLSTHPTLLVDPDSPSQTSPLRSVCMGFYRVKSIADCITLAHGAVSSFGECGLPCGLRGSLCTLQLFRSALHQCFLHSCNTRYEWLVRPSSAGTSTLQEAPSFAWRTSALAEQSERGARPERSCAE